jgi:glycosyltransferase involved in cell wall biosynthesis
MCIVSVLMNCYNGQKYLREALNSVFRQSYTNWEIIFIDNCSVDQSAEIAKSFGEKVKYYKTFKNIPLYAARNFGLQFVSGEYVAFLDVDDVWGPKKLEQQLPRFTDKVAVVYTDVKYINAEGTYLNKSYPALHEGRITQALLRRNCIAISSVMVRVDVIKDFLFNSQYNLIGDYDLWLRISTKYLIRHTRKGDFLFYSRQHSKSLGKINQKNWIYEIRIHYREFLKIYKIRYPNIIFYILKSEFGHLIGRY